MDYSSQCHEDFDDLFADQDELIARLEEQGQLIPRGKKEKHPQWGTHGPLFVGPLGGVYIWQRRGDEIIRGWERKGIQAEDFQKEAVYANEDTSPRVEIPGILIRNMRVDRDPASLKMNSRDMAVFWRLFAEARQQGIGNPEFSITVDTLKRYLGIASVDRVVESLKRIAAGRFTCRFWHPGCQFKRSLPFITLTLPTDGKLKGSSVVKFALPHELVGATQWSRDYAWVDIMALPRFSSKFSWALWFQLSNKAGQLARKRKPIEVGEADLAEMLGIPYKCPGTWKKAIVPVLADIAAVDGPRKNFRHIVETWTEADGSTGYFIEIGSAAKKLKKMKAAPITEAVQKTLDLNRLNYPLDPEQMPSLMSVRQAATLVNRPVAIVDSNWRLDVYGASKGYLQTVIGHESADFLQLITEVGVEKVFEYWVSKRDFGVPIKGLKVAPADPEELQDPPRMANGEDDYVCAGYEIEEEDEYVIQEVADYDDENIPY